MGRLGSLVAALLLVAACGDDDAPGGPADAGPDTSPGPDGDVGPDAGEPDSPGGDAGPLPEPPGLAWRDCYDGLRCATLEVPLDYADPSLGTVQIAIARSAARRPSRRLGTLIYNPGGPGNPSVALLPQLRGQLALLAPDLVNRFDLVGFDWRGVADSRPVVRCLDDAANARFDALDVTPDDDAERAAIYAFFDDVLPGCVEALDGDLLARVDSLSAARDLDRVREALGEDVIDYLGVSYGTRLGAMYATAFPERLRAAVLDSPVPPGDDRLAFVRLRAAAFETALRRFAEWCAGEPTCPLRSDAVPDADAILARIDALVSRLDADPLPVADGGLATEARLMDTLAGALGAGRAQWTSLARALAEADAGDGTRLLPTGDGFVLEDGTTWRGAEARLAIQAADQPFPPDLTREAYDGFVRDELVPLAPRMGPLIATESRGLVGWPVAAAHPLPDVSAADAPPLLLLAGTYDAAAPYEGALELRDALGNGSYLVTHEGDGHVQIAQSGCIRDAMVAFLLEPSSAPAVTTCAPE